LVPELRKNILEQVYRSEEDMQRMMEDAGELKSPCDIAKGL